jgi:hypothetical protein
MFIVWKTACSTTEGIEAGSINYTKKTLSLGPNYALEKEPK